ncbi:MAG: hypothetical protein HW387_136 [Parachlamydiales bacterium]|nr:hypothetical protein [Parachlamydiales bacterium]
MRYRFLLFSCSYAWMALYGQEFADPSEALFRDLEMVRIVDRSIHDKLPVLFNYQGQGGYFAMPSARMPEAGNLSFGYSWLPPYNVWSLSFQFFDHVETSGAYWIYRGITEGNFGHLGYGDDADRSANIKLCLLRREDGFPFIPDFSIGWNDFLGSCRFNSFYGVATEELLDYHLEATLGWGRGRIKGFFGGLAWTPWRRAEHLLKGLTLAAEYDANDYKRHPAEHPGGRIVKSRINAGVQYRLGKYLQASVSTIRGCDWAAGLSLHYNLGQPKGLFPKIFDVPAYKAPIDTEPVGRVRTGEEMARDLAYAFKEQGFDLYSVYLVPAEEGLDSLYLKLVNVRYREEDIVRDRIQRVLGSLSPSNISHATVVVEADGVVLHEYRYRLADLVRYQKGFLSDNEFRIIAPIREASSLPSSYDSIRLFQRSKSIWTLTFRPRTMSYFGSSKGKFKGQAGFSVGPEGYLWDQLYYCCQATYTVFSMMQDIKSWDVLNPSRLINVRTDALLYHQAHSFHVDLAYLQKSWNVSSGWFTRLAAGYFETAYGGAAWEALYYPVRSNWAIGFEAAVLWKRRYFGLGFYDKIRKLTPEGMIWVPYIGYQYFVDFYYDYKPLNLDFKISAGQFLARDKGARFDVGRTFPSGLRVGLWYTFTNANDVVNNQRYYDKGFSITMPLDFFLNKSSRTRIGYGMSAWLRDCGAKAATGKELYHTLYYERYNPHPVVY